MKKYLFIFIIINLSIIMTFEYGFPYGGPVHRRITRRAADISELDDYLKDNLGFSNGINTTLTNPRVLGSKR